MNNFRALPQPELQNIFRLYVFQNAEQIMHGKSIHPPAKSAERKTLAFKPGAILYGLGKQQAVMSGFRNLKNSLHTGMLQSKFLDFS
jgi:hypothetical protein